MAYTVYNFKTKKALKEAVKRYHDDAKIGTHHEQNARVRCYQPGLGPDLSNFTGKIALEGPHYPAAHKWYCEAELVNGIVVKIK